MNILTLIIKKEFLDKILAGTKKTETREIRPNNVKKYCNLNEKGDFIDMRKYDAIQFYEGYNTNRRAVLIENKGAQLVEIHDEKGNQIIYKHQGQEYVTCEVDYSLGKVLNKNF